MSNIRSPARSTTLVLPHWAYHSGYTILDYYIGSTTLVLSHWVHNTGSLQEDEGSAGRVEGKGWQPWSRPIKDRVMNSQYRPTKNTSNKRTAQVLGMLNVCLLAILPNEGLGTFLRGVASSVIYYDLFIT